ncbi:MAG: response regulator [Clostridiaceae bacterium]
MNIVIADDQAEVRSALKVLLEHENINGTTDEAEDVGSLLMKTESESPDMVLLDWELSGAQMEGVIPVLRRKIPGLRIVAMSVRPEAAKSAADAGVDAFFSKGENSDRLLEYIHALLE